MMLREQLASEHIERRRRFDAAAHDPDAKPFVKTVIERLAKEADRERLANLPKVVLIQVMVARAYGATRAEIVGRSQVKDIVLPRHVAIWLARAITGRSLSNIGRRFGPRDHTTILHALGRIGRMMDADPLFAARVEGLRVQIEKTGGESDDMRNMRSPALRDRPAAGGTDPAENVRRARICRSRMAASHASGDMHRGGAPETVAVFCADQ
jgi:hypothetical protein